MVSIDKCTFDNIVEYMNNTNVKNNILLIVYPWGRDISEIMGTISEIEISSEKISDYKLFSFDIHKDHVADIGLTNTFFTKEIADTMGEFIVDTVSTNEDCHFIVVEFESTVKSDAITKALYDQCCDADENSDINCYTLDTSEWSADDVSDYNRIVSLLTLSIADACTRKVEEIKLEEKAEQEAINRATKKDIRDGTERVYSALLHDIEQAQKSCLSQKKVPSLELLSTAFDCSILAAKRALDKLFTEGYIDEDGNIMSIRETDDSVIKELENKFQEIVTSYKRMGIPAEQMMSVFETYIDKIYNSDIGSKRVIVMDAEQVEKYNLDTNLEKSVIVSIRSTGGRQAFIKPCKLNNIQDVLFLQFDDVSIDDGYSRIMTDAQGDEIVNFISKWIPTVDVIIFQCEYGESRSVGCAEAVSEYIFSKMLPDNITEKMNNLCYNVTYRAIKRFSESE